ncbi:hypothetical protein MTO96_001992 [Rhipicephalus appendiculatus]
MEARLKHLEADADSAKFLENSPELSAARRTLLRHPGPTFAKEGRAANSVLERTVVSLFKAGRQRAVSARRRGGWITRAQQALSFGRRLRWCPKEGTVYAFRAADGGSARRRVTS